MSEKLLGIAEVARRLDISKRQVYRLLPRLIARGLQPVQLGRLRKFRQVSLDRMISQAAEKEEPLIEISPGTAGRFHE